LALDAHDTDVLWAVSALLLALERPTVSVNEYAVSLDPVNAEIHGALSEAYWNEGRFEEALETATTVLRLSPDADDGHWGAARSLLQLGRLKEALAETGQISYELDRLWLLSVIYHRQGKQERSDAMLRELIDKFPESYFRLAVIAARRGEANLAFEYLYKATEAPVFFPLSINFPNIVDDPRWAALMEKMGRSPEQLAAIKFEYTPPAYAGQASP
jgi:tetratricopeptide (TPR) repeat protein